MNDLHHSFTEAQERRLFQIIYEAVADGLTPWVPDRIAIYEDYYGSYPEREIVITVKRFPNLVFRTKPDYFLLDPTQMVMSIAEKAFNFFRYREGLPVEDHIILGEN